LSINAEYSPAATLPQSSRAHNSITPVSLGEKLYVGTSTQTTCHGNDTYQVSNEPYKKCGKSWLHKLVTLNADKTNIQPTNQLTNQQTE